MPKYFFKAKDSRGKDISGSREAQDERDLSNALKQEGMVLIFADTQEISKRSGFFPHLNITLLENITAEDKLMLVRNLQVMVAAGVALPRCLDILAEQASKRKLKIILSEVKEEIMKGKGFSETIAKYPGVFSEFFCNMVSIGEKTGNLDKMLKDLAYQMEKDYKLKAKIQGAMTYPAVIISVLLILGFVMIAFILPKIIGIFEGFGTANLPGSTKFLMGLGKFFSKASNVFGFFAILVFLVVIGITFFRTKIGKRLMDKISLKIPVMGPLIKKGNVANIVGNLGILMESGISVLQALSILSNSTTNVFYKESLSDAGQQIQKGKKISESLANHSSLYTPTVIQMVSVGEETGMTGEILKKLSEFYEDEVSRAAENLTTIIEPILMLVVGGAVGFFAIAMFSPIYSSLGNIK